MQKQLITRLRQRTNDRVKMSYAFRPLTKNKYLIKHKDESVRILAKGRALFPDIKPIVTLGGGASGVKRVISIARTAAFLRRAGVGSVIHPDMSEHWCFVPSTCWRNIRTGILSTARFTGILFIGEQRLAVYDIGDGAMEWQMKAERSLFYWKYSSYETKATGMLLICDENEQEQYGIVDCKLADMLSDSEVADSTVTLTIHEPLPSMKDLTSSVQEHWTELVQTAIGKALAESTLPYFEKALVHIEVVTPKGTNNARLWDTSNRAVNLIINNLKGVFFEDDNLEHMAFSVVGRWGEKGVTIIRVLSFDKLERMMTGLLDASP